MFNYVNPTWLEGMREVEGKCPNAGSPCNCIGDCLPFLVSKDDTRADDEIRAKRKATGRGWSKDTFTIFDKE